MPEAEAPARSEKIGIPPYVGSPKHATWMRQTGLPRAAEGGSAATAFLGARLRDGMMFWLVVTATTPHTTLCSLWVRPCGKRARGSAATKVGFHEINCKLMHCALIM